MICGMGYGSMIIEVRLLILLYVGLLVIDFFLSDFFCYICFFVLYVLVLNLKY